MTPANTRARCVVPCHAAGDAASAIVAPQALRRFPWTTWMRIARIVEGSETVALLVGGERIARSAGGVTIALESSAVRWHGTGPRARLFGGVRPAARVVRARS